MTKNLVIVESPSKSKTIEKYLGKDFKVVSSKGHIRDLSTTGKYGLGVNVESDFKPSYVLISGKKKLVSELKKEVKSADRVFLATDPDREGEAISWHLKDELGIKDKDYERVLFYEITKDKVLNAFDNSSKIDDSLVRSQETRRILDRIIGFRLSKLMQSKTSGKSAGRVQSVALKLIVDREREINAFIPEEYWTIEADFDDFVAALFAYNNKNIEIKTEAEADSILSKLKNEFFIKSIDQKEKKKKAKLPFITSTLQQEASSKLNFSAKKTMSIAQKLYEGVDLENETVGLITYMRTDSVRLSDDFVKQGYKYINDKYGKEYVGYVKEVKSKGNIQDAHEAIRPTNTSRTPDILKESLSRDQYRLYKLIWERFTASQMVSALFDTLSVKISASKYIFRSSGSVLKFDGYLKVYNKNEDSAEESKIPELAENQILKLQNVKDEQHFTQPPARYSEAMLVKTMEDLGIGRPSTYAATISTIVLRRYVTRENKMFYPTDLGEIVNDIMRNNFENIVDIDFTAKMESELDTVEEGELPWKDILRTFYSPFNEKLKLAEENIEQIDVEDEKTDILCENCGENMVIKFGKFGKFLACPSFPECRNTKPFFEEAGVKCPECEGKIIIKKTKKGRKYFGCEHNPECEFMSWSKPTGERCPECNEHLIEKGTKTKKIVCSSQKCGYSIDKPEEEKE